MARLKIFDNATGLWVYVGGGDESPYVGPEPPVVVMDGMLWWDTDDNSILPSTVDPAVLAADLAFTSKYELLGYGVTPFTTTQRDLLSGSTRWLGRQIYNLTTKRHETWDGTVWWWPGFIAMTEGTSSSWTNATSTSTDITVSAGVAPSLTLALSTTRRYKVSFDARFSSSVTGDTVQIRMNEGGVDRKATKHQLYSFEASSCAYWYVFVPASSASVTYKMLGARSVGSGTVSASALAVSPMQYLIEDVGPS